MMFAIGIGVILVLAIVILLLIPAEKKQKKRKKKEDEAVVEKDWKEAAEKMDRHIQALKQRVIDMEKEEKNKDRQIAIEQAKNQKLQEKLTQEREWQKKEEDTLEKRAKEVDSLKKEMKSLQDAYTSEHTLFLKYEHDVKDMKVQLDTIQNQKRTLESELAQVSAKAEGYRREIVELTKENAELTKKRDDTSWIAKTEYARVEKLLKEKEVEIERILRESQK